MDILKKKKLETFEKFVPFNTIIGSTRRFSKTKFIFRGCIEGFKNRTPEVALMILYKKTTTNSYTNYVLLSTIFGYAELIFEVVRIHRGLKPEN